MNTNDYSKGFAVGWLQGYVQGSRDGFIVCMNALIETLRLAYSMPTAAKQAPADAQHAPNSKSTAGNKL